MDSIRIHTISEYITAVCDVDRSLKETHGYRYTTLFRGQSDASNVLLPSIGRSVGEPIDAAILNEERNMIEMAKFKLPDVFRNDMQPIDLLALLQHHGIPTRLLDVSENALVGLYFACHGDEDKDGEVLVFQHDDNNVANYPFVNAIADSYRFAREERTSLEAFFEKISKQSYYKDQEYLYEDQLQSVQDGAKWIADCCQNLMIIYAQSFHLRQRIQRGRYILFPNQIVTDDEGKLYFTKNISPVSKQHASIIGRYIIPKEEKERMRNELRLLGISKDLLFLDNEDIVCKEIADRVKLNTAMTEEAR